MRMKNFETMDGNEAVARVDEVDAGQLSLISLISRKTDLLKSHWADPQGSAFFLGCGWSDGESGCIYWTAPLMKARVDLQVVLQPFRRPVHYVVRCRGG